MSQTIIAASFSNHRSPNQLLEFSASNGSIDVTVGQKSHSRVRCTFVES
jgi:DUF4097 and DUF4098 domain-containing protein YvlB